MNETASSSASPGVMFSAANRLYYAALISAVLGNMLVGASFSFQKHAHNLERDGKITNAACSFYMLIGLVLNGVGELGNLAAYAFAPASIVCPLGAIGVIFNQIFAYIVLRETVRCFNLTGSAMAIIGSLCILVTAPPSHSESEDVFFLQQRLGNLDFMLYLTTVFVIISLLKLVEEKRGKENVFIYVGLCACIGGLVVLLTRGFTTVIRVAILGTNAATTTRNQFLLPLTYVILLAFPFCLFVQQHHFNKLTASFDNSQAIPPFFVFFNLSALAASAILFADFAQFTWEQLLFFAVGALLIFGGVYFINKKPDEYINRDDLSEETSARCC